MDIKKAKVRSHNNCCVVGCTNKGANTSIETSFYSFPGRLWEAEKRSQWIQSVRRKNADGSTWCPSAQSRICSQHFVGNKRSNHPMSPSYMPTIFPEIYKKRELSQSQIGRFDRSQKRSAISHSKCKCLPDEHAGQDEDQLMKFENIELPKYENIESPKYENIESPKYVDVGTQTDRLILSRVTKEVAAIPVPTKPTMVDKEVSAGLEGSSNETGTLLHCQGFHGHSSILDDDTAMVDLAGVTVQVFMLLLSYIPNSADHKVSKENKLLIFLMKMKTGYTYSALRVLFGVHRSTVSTIFKTVLTQLKQATMSFVFWPSKSSVMSTMPPEFKATYPNCRVIIDCSEFRVEQPKEVDNRNYFYSDCRSGFTMKFLIGITPSGVVSFISKCYGGRSSDSSITVDSGLLELLRPGDDVMANKGFPGIKTVLKDKNVVIVMPSFLQSGRFSEEEVNETYRVSSVRIHVERMIQRVKMYNILQKVPTELFPHIDDIVRMCCVLANLQLPIINTTSRD